MGTPFSLTSNYTLEPKRQNLFTLVFNTVPGNATGTNEQIQLDMESFVRPQFSTSTNEMKRLNMKYKVAGAPELSQTASAVFRDTIEQNLGYRFYKWNQTIFNRDNGTMGYAVAYKTDANLYVFDPMGKVIEKWLYKGIYPQSTNYNDLTYEGSSILKVNVTFNFDLAKLVEVYTGEAKTSDNSVNYGAPSTTDDINIDPSNTL